MKIFFKELFIYNNHYNLKLAQSIVANQNAALSKTVKLFSHILNAHHIWNSRILSESNNIGVWEIHDPSDFDSLIETNHMNSKTIIDTFSLEDSMQYSKGKGSKKIRDVLFHIINHSTYHRGQIATNMRKNRVEPIDTDYIFFEK